MTAKSLGKPFACGKINRFLNFAAVAWLYYKDVCCKADEMALQEEAVSLESDQDTDFSDDGEAFQDVVECEEK